MYSKMVHSYTYTPRDTVHNDGRARINRFPSQVTVRYRHQILVPVVYGNLHCTDEGDRGVLSPCSPPPTFCTSPSHLCTSPSPFVYFSLPPCTLLPPPLCTAPSPPCTAPFPPPCALLPPPCALLPGVSPVLPPPPCQPPLYINGGRRTHIYHVLYIM
jgi:hypothetical protein